MKKTLFRIIIGTVLLVLLTSQTEAVTSLFPDVPSDHQNLSAINYLKSEGIVQGYEDGSFQPGKKINRAEFLKIVMKASSHTPSGQDCHNDVQNQWFAPYICKATQLELVQGYDDGSFKPEKNINFAEASKIIVNILSLNKNSNNNDIWYHQFVVALETAKAIPVTITEFDEEINRGEMAEIIWRIKTNVQCVEKN